MDLSLGSARPMLAAIKRCGSLVEFSLITVKATWPGLMCFNPSLREINLQFGGMVEETRTMLQAAIPAFRSASSKLVSLSRCFTTPLVRNIFLATNAMVQVCDASVVLGWKFFLLWKSNKKALQCQTLSQDFLGNFLNPKAAHCVTESLVGTFPTVSRRFRLQSFVRWGGIMIRVLPLVGVCLCGGIMAGVLALSADSVSEKARKLHFSSIVVDTHDDTTQRFLDGDFDLLPRNNSGSIDIPRMKEGGLGAIFFSIWIPSKITGPEAVKHALDQIDAVREQVRR